MANATRKTAAKVAVAKKSPAKKVAARKAASKSAVAKKSYARNAVAKKSAPAKKAVAKKAVYGATEPGYNKTASGVLVPANNKKTATKTMSAAVVPVSKIEKGLTDAFYSVNRVLEASIRSVADGIKESLEIEKIELSLSFNAKGEFIGIGVGGAASVKVCLRPVS